MKLKDRYKLVYVITACKKCGPIQQTLNLIKYLDRSKYLPILITIYEEPKDGSSQLDRFIELGVIHYFIPLSKIDIMLGRTKTLKKKIQSLCPSIVHSLGVFPSYTLSRIKYPNHVTTLRNYIYEDLPAKYGRLLGFLLAKLHLYAMKHTTQTWTCSESLSNQYKKRLGLEYPYIQNGVDITKFATSDEVKKKALRMALSIPENQLVFIYSGQLITRKDQRFLIELFNDTPDFQDHCLLLLGDGTDFDELKIFSSSMRNVIMPGSVDNVCKYLQASDVYISSSRSEGLPNGVLEAMAVGLPVILSDIEQHKEIILRNMKIGFLYKLGDKLDCVEKIRKLLSLNMLEYGREASIIVQEEFSAEVMSNKYQEEYDRIITD